MTARGVEAQESRPVAGDPAARTPRQSGVDRQEDGEYRLNYGDVLEIHIRGATEIRKTARVELNGEVSLPLGGRARVLGLPLHAAEAVIKGLAGSRPATAPIPDGPEGPAAPARDEVLVTIAEYRPVYLLGEIRKPGEISYRPGMTARQAIALSGGLDAPRLSATDPFIEAAGIRGERAELWSETVRTRARLARIELELEGRAQLPADLLADAPVDKAYLERTLKAESEILARRLAAQSAEIAHIISLIEQGSAKLDSLRQQLAAETKSSEVDGQEAEQLKDLHRRGSLPFMRLIEIRRIQLANSTRVLQTRVQYHQAERELAEARRRLETAQAGNRSALLAEQLEHAAIHNGLQVRLSTANEKLERLDVLQSRLTRRGVSKLTITIHRSLSDHNQTFAGNEESVLFPGDTLEVARENEPEGKASTRRGTKAAGELPSRVEPSITVEVPRKGGAKNQR